MQLNILAFAGILALGVALAQIQQPPVDSSKPKVSIHNRCPYQVNIWSSQATSCPVDSQRVVVPSGGLFQENFREVVNGVAPSLRISRESQCQTTANIRLDYVSERNNGPFNYNYFNLSYLDCEDHRCPTAAEGIYLKSGNQDGKFLSNPDNTIGPIFGCRDFNSCSSFVFVRPEDLKTKSCDLDADLELYLCGSNAP